MTRVVGLDLSLTSTGVAVAVDGAVTTRRVKSKGRKGATVLETSRRLDTIVSGVFLAAQIPSSKHPECAPDLAVIEAPSFGSVHGAQHERGGLWWLVVRELRWMGVPIATLSPAGRARYATGRGNAGKDEVLAAVVKRYPDVDVTGNDVADAVLLCAVGCRWLGEPFDDVPKTHLTALDGASWPTRDAA